MLGIVLAGGAGVRLGAGPPKALRVVAGMTLLERALATARAAAHEVVVAASTDLALPIAGALRADDPPGAAGPLAGMVAGLGARPFHRAIVIGVDFPLVTAELLRALLDRLAAGAAPAVVPAPGGVPQPLVASYAPDAAVCLAATLDAGERSAIAAVRTLDPLWLDDAAIAALPGGAENFFNVNTPADLAEAERRLAARAGAGA